MSEIQELRAAAQSRSSRHRVVSNLNVWPHDLDKANDERAVSAHIGAMPLLWVGIDDPAGPDSDRGVVERGAIALLSGARVPSPDPPSRSWLGHHAQRPAIRGSGLWNVNHVDERYDPAFLDVLERWICS